MKEYKYKLKLTSRSKCYICKRKLMNNFSKGAYPVPGTKFIICGCCENSFWRSNVR